MIVSLGDLADDIVVMLSGPPAVGTDTAAVIRRRRGGSAANVAVATAAAGAPAGFVGAVGRDRVGQQLIDDLIAAGVTPFVQYVDRPTATIVVLVDPSGERTMLPDRGAAGHLQPSPLPAATSWLHVPLYSWQTTGAAADAAVAEARGRSIPISVDLSSVAVIEAFGDRWIERWLGRVDPTVVFANELESGLVKPRASGVWITKRGAQSVVIHDVGEVDVPPLAAVADTTGAGDWFAGGFLAAAAAGSDPKAAARAGVASAQRWLVSTDESVG